MSENSKTRGKTKKKTRGSLLVKLGLCSFCGYLAFSLVSLQIEIANQKAALAQVEQQIAEYDAQNTETERLLTLGEDQAYRARIARDKLDMGYADETVFRDASAS